MLNGKKYEALPNAMESKKEEEPKEEATIPTEICVAKEVESSEEEIRTPKPTSTSVAQQKVAVERVSIVRIVKIPVDGPIL